MRKRVERHIAAFAFKHGARPKTVTDSDGKVRRLTRALRRGMPNRRIIAELRFNSPTLGSIDVAYHATKGWRVRRIGA